MGRRWPWYSGDIGTGAAAAMAPSGVAGIEEAKHGGNRASLPRKNGLGFVPKDYLDITILNKHSDDKECKISIPVKAQHGHQLSGGAAQFCAPPRLQRRQAPAADQAAHRGLGPRGRC